MSSSPMPGDPGNRGVESVARALDLMDALADGERGLVALSRAVGLRPSTAHRLLATMVTAGYVLHDRVGKYRLGARALRAGRGASAEVSGYVEALQPFLDRIHRVGRKTSNLFVLESNRVILLRQVMATDGPDLNLRPGMTLPIHATASGKACLAFCDQDRAEEILESVTMARLTPRTQTRVTGLLRELERVRKTGYAIAHREYSNRLTGIAAPILSRDGAVIGALSVSLTNMDRVRLTSREAEDLGELVSVAAAEGSALLAGDQRE